MWFLYAIITLIFLFYLRVLQIYSIWKNKDVKGPKPTFLIGNFATVLKREDSFGTFLQKIYDSYPEEKVVGLYEGLTPMIVVRDPEIIKQVIIKDFSSFTNRGAKALAYMQEPLSRNLFFLEGTEWKVLRRHLNPFFRTSSLKKMSESINERCIPRLNNYLDRVENTTVEVRSVAVKYVLKGLLAVVFGLDIDTYAEKSNFVQLAEETIDFNGKAVYCTIVDRVIPGIIDLLGIKVMPSKVLNFYRNLTNSVPDDQDGDHFLNLMRKLQKQDTIVHDSSKLKITDAVMEAQVMLFYVGGFDTTASNLSFMLYELALNQDIQEKCYLEAMQVLEKHKGKLTYEALSELEYISMVMDEALRKYAVGVVQLRECTKKIQLDGTDITLEPGTSVVIPNTALHNDPRFFPEPERFDPERFGPENKGNINKYAYMPFGDGPRNCIGTRFAKLQTLIGISNLLVKIRIDVCEETPKKIVVDPTLIVPTAIGGIRLRFNRR